MFTGIVEDLGTLRAVARGAESARLRIATGLPLTEVEIGDSIAVDGCCLTVVSKASDAFDVDAAVETLRVTTLGQRAPGDALHLERALRFGGRLDGHLVSGHIDGVGEVVARQERGPALEVTFRGPAPIIRYVIHKGSIAVDGVSLTVNEVKDDTFSVVLIPHTRDVTHLARKPVGASINLEADLIGKYVERLAAPWSAAAGRAPGGVTLELLQEQGYAK